MAGEVFSESKPHCRTQQCGENRTSSNPLVLGIEQTVTSVLDQELSRGVESSHCSTSAPLCRQFWKAGNYDSLPSSSKLTFPKGTSHNGVGFHKAEVITTIGFLKEAPHVKVHGFNVYHKNRLILPFWPVITYSTETRGRGVVGVLEANFIQPTHNKQDFEKTPAFQKLEQRLNDMTFEYWNLHCGLIGYQHVKRKRKTTASKARNDSSKSRVSKQPDIISRDISATSSTESLPDRELSETSNFLSGESKNNGPVKRKVHFSLLEAEPMKKKAGLEVNVTNDEHLSNSIEENKKLHAKCSKHERDVKELNLKVVQLRTELEEAQNSYDCLLAELKLAQTF